MRQTGNGHFAQLVAAFEPATRLRVETDLEPAILPSYFFAAAQTGLTKSLVDSSWAVFILDALFHEVDSRPLDFEYAGRLLAREVGETPPAEADPTLAEARSYWEEQWAEHSEGWRQLTQLFLVQHGFSPCSGGFERDLGVVRQRLELRPNSRRLPSAVDVWTAVIVNDWSDKAAVQRRQGLSFELENPEYRPDLNLALEWFDQRRAAEQLLQLEKLAAGPEAVLLLESGRGDTARARVEQRLHWLEGRLGWNRERQALEELLARLP